MKCRLVEPDGTRAWLRVYEGEGCPGKGYHDAQTFLADSDLVTDNELGGRPDDYPDEAWPTKCDACDHVFTPEAQRQVFRKTIYNTPEKLLVPGDMWWADYYGNGKGGCVFHSEGCDGTHLFAMTPDGHNWDIDGRASNCTKPNDKAHRCWVRHGEPPHITVDKRGNTCAAGAGSIAMPGYHGFLRNGAFT